VAVQQLVQAQLDGGQQVVEVVRHAAGQLADGLHLLRLGQLKLHLLLLGHVDHVGHDAVFGAVQIEVGDPAGIAGQAHLERAGAAFLHPGLGLVARGRVDQVAEHPAGLAARHGDQGRVGLQDLRFEGLQPFQQGRAERRGAGEGVQRAGRRRRALDHRRQGGGWSGGRGLDDWRQADQQAAAGQARDLGGVIRTASAQHALGHLALAGLDQGGEQAGTGHAFGQAAGLAHQRPPDRIGGQQAAVGGGQRRRFAQGLDEAFRLVGVIARSGRALDGHQAQDRDAGHAQQQQQASQGCRASLQRRRGRKRRRGHEKYRRADQPRIEAPTRSAGRSFVLKREIGHGALCNPCHGEAATHPQAEKQ
jgi:hypothetical protein